MNRLLLATALLVAGCEIPRNIPTCPRIIEYSGAFQAQAQAQIAATIPEGSPVDVMLQDGMHLRDQVRSCERERGKHAL